MFPPLSRSRGALQGACSPRSLKLKHRVASLMVLTLSAGHFGAEGTRSTTRQRSGVALLSQHRSNVTLQKLRMLTGNARQRKKQR